MTALTEPSIFQEQASKFATRRPDFEGEQRHAFSLDDLAYEKVACPRCDARPGQACRTRSGRVASHMHYGRIQPIYQAFDEGYEEGVRNIARYVVRRELIKPDVDLGWLRRYLTEAAS